MRSRKRTNDTKALKKELNIVHKPKVWKLGPMTEEAEVLKSKYVFAWEMKDGLAVMGAGQCLGVDFTESV